MAHKLVADEEFTSHHIGVLHEYFIKNCFTLEDVPAGIGCKSLNKSKRLRKPSESALLINRLNGGWEHPSSLS